MENPELAKKLGEWAYMNSREQEEMLLAYGTRKQKKAVKERRKARERAKEGEGR